MNYDAKTKKELITELEGLKRRIADLETSQLGHHEAQKDMQSTSYFLQTLLDTIPMPVFYKDVEGSYLGCNRAFEGAFGICRDNLIGKSLHTFYAETGKDVVEKYREMDSVLFSQPGVQVLERQILYADGSRHDVVFNKATFSDAAGRLAGLVGVIYDITERKSAERALRESEHLHRVILGNISDAVFITDDNGNYTYVCPNVDHIFGYTTPQVEEMHHISGLLGEQLFDPVQLREQGEIQNIEREVLTVSGRKRVLLVTVKRVSIQDGTVLYVCRDITERKEVQEALRQAHDELELRVEARTAELMEANRRLDAEMEKAKRAEQASRSNLEKLQFFAHSVMHDLKSPAVGIHGLARLLHRQYWNHLDQKGRQYCNQILTVAEHIAALVEQINLYIVTKDAPLTLDTLDFKEILQIIKDEFSVPLSIRRIEWSAPEMDVEIRADRLCLLRVFRNLVDNALKYGGEKLSAIQIGYKSSPDFHIFSISDNGVGLETEDLARLFRPFQRDETARNIEGTGLGLAIVKEIAERHQGEVWVESGPGTGITFSVSISKTLPELRGT